MTNQLQAYQGMAYGELTTQDISTIRETIAKDANDSQFRLFMGVAKSSGANPLTNEIYAAVRGGQLTIQYGYDFYVRKAKESDGYLGYDVQLVHENDETAISRKTDDKGRSFMVINEHDITFPRGKIIACYAIAFREGVTPFTVFMEVDAVDHLKKSNIGMQKTMWTNYFDDMFKKHVLRRALKGQFGLEFDDQVQDGPVEPPKERKDVTPNQEVVEQPAKQPEQEVVENNAEHLRDEINNKFKQLFKTKKEILDWMNTNAPDIDPKNATDAEMVGLIELLDVFIDSQNTSDDQLL